MSNEQHNYMTPKKAAEYLNMPVQTVYYLMKTGELPSFKIGGRYRIPKDKVDAKIEAQLTK